MAPEVTDFPGQATLSKHSKFDVGTTEKTVRKQKSIYRRINTTFL